MTPRTKYNIQVRKQAYTFMKTIHKLLTALLLAGQSVNGLWAQGDAMPAHTDTVPHPLHRPILKSHWTYAPPT